MSVLQLVSFSGEKRNMIKLGVGLIEQLLSTKISETLGLISINMN
jgi:hypothetical protein